MTRTSPTPPPTGAPENGVAPVGGVRGAGRALRGLDSSLTVRVGAAVLVYLLMWVTHPGFATSANTFNILNQFAPVGLIALGAGIGMIGGEFDLSLGSMAVLAGVIAIQMQSVGILAAIIITIGLCSVLGALQGLLISRLEVGSIVISLGSLVALRGIAFVIAGGTAVSLTDLSAADTASKRYWLFSPFSMVTLAAFAVAWVFLRYARSGRHLYAIGGGRVQAAASGVPVARTIIGAFAVSAALAATAGTLISVQGGTANPSSLQNLILTGITGAMIGGVGLTGGRGSVVGILLGTLTLQFLLSALLLGGATTSKQDLATGGLLIAVVIIELLVQFAPTIVTFFTDKTTTTEPQPTPA